jgi:hypothetical protein
MIRISLQACHRSPSPSIHLRRSLPSSFPQSRRLSLEGGHTCQQETNPSTRTSKNAKLRISKRVMRSVERVKKGPRDCLGYGQQGIWRREKIRLRQSQCQAQAIAIAIAIAIATPAQHGAHQTERCGWPAVCEPCTIFSWLLAPDQWIKAMQAAAHSLQASAQF